MSLETYPQSEALVEGRTTSFKSFVMAVHLQHDQRVKPQKVLL